MFYATYSPRGFYNEFDIYAFTTRALRDQFVSAVPRTRYSKYYQAWVQCEPNASAESISAAQVAKITRQDRKDVWGKVTLSVPELFTTGRDGYGRENLDYRVIDNLDSDGFPVDPSNEDR